MNTTRAVIRRFSAKCSEKGSDANKGLAKLKRLQEEFQKADGKPIYLKKGISDQLLYRFTMALSVLGIGAQLVFFWGYLKPNPSKD